MGHQQVDLGLGVDPVKFKNVQKYCYRAIKLMGKMTIELKT